MASALALLPSPFLGPAVWQPVADVLTALGRRVIAPPAAPAAPRTPRDVLDGLLAALPEDEDMVLVPHSNAGLYAPALTDRRRVTACVLVDALLPAGAGETPVAPAALLDALRATADADGLLPPWTSWWPDADVARLFPSAAVRRRVEGEQHRLPLSYLQGSVPVPPGWDRCPGAYLAFGDTYDPDRARAAARGWPVATMPGAHLHMLVAPEQVAGRILDLAALARAAT